jgi:hypothetical protein
MDAERSQPGWSWLAREGGDAPTFLSPKRRESFGSAMSEKGEGADSAAGRHSRHHQRVRREREVERELDGRREPQEDAIAEEALLVRRTPRVVGAAVAAEPTFTLPAGAIAEMRRLRWCWFVKNPSNPSRHRGGARSEHERRSGRRVKVWSAGRRGGQQQQLLGLVDRSGPSSDACASPQDRCEDGPRMTCSDTWPADREEWEETKMLREVQAARWSTESAKVGRLG